MQLLGLTVNRGLIEMKNISEILLNSYLILLNDWSYYNYNKLNNHNYSNNYNKIINLIKNDIIIENNQQLIQIMNIIYQLKVPGFGYLPMK